MDAFESAGAWHTPEAPDDEVVGVLSFDPAEGFKLEIPLGGLGELDDFMDRINASTRTALAHGTLRNGKVVTLVDAVMTNSSVHFPGTRQEEHKALHGFVGQVECEANPLVDEVRVKYSHLRDWVMTHPCGMTRPVGEGRFTGTAQYSYDPISETELAAANGWALRLSHVCTQSMPSVTGFKVTHDCALTLVLDESTEFASLTSDVLPSLWQFYSFCLGRSVDVMTLEIRLAGTETWLEVGQAQTVSEAPEKVVMDAYMMLSMPQLGDRLPAVLARWMSFEGDEERAVSLMVGLGSECSVPTDLRFLAAAQALEAMSRVDANERELTRDEFRRRLRVIREAVEEPTVRDWARDKLAFGNQRSAAALLQDLLADIGEYALLVAPDQERFLSDYRDNRNFYTHRDDRRARCLLPLGELYVLTEALLLLLKAATLRKLGYSPEETNTVMNDCQGALSWRRTTAEQYAVPPVGPA